MIAVPRLLPRRRRRGSPGAHRPVRAALVGLSVLAFACASSSLGESEARAVLAEYFAAVQAGDAAPVAALLADCSDPSACAARVEGRLTAVEAERAEGRYAFDDPWGFGLVRALVLGAGGYWTVESVENDGDSARVRLEARTQYTPRETRGLPRAAVIEYLGRPLGHVERVPRGGAGPGTLRWHLVSLGIEARLRRAASPDGPGWRVESLRALPETATFEQVTWRPE